MFMETLEQCAPWIAEAIQFLLIVVLWIKRNRVKNGNATVEDLTALRDYHAKMLDKLNKELEGVKK